MTNPVHRIIQVTDLHMGETSASRLAGICTYESFTAVLADIAAQPERADLLMVSGDVAASGKHAAYHLFLECVRRIDSPYAWLPGNHDDFFAMQSRFASAAYSPLLALDDWRVVSLNSAVPGRVGGLLVADELMFLERALNDEPDAPFIVFIHHPPVSVGCAWLDKQKIANADALEKIVRSAGNVKAIFTGHVHQPFETQWAGCSVYTTPSTCYQFAANSVDFAMSDALPGYRWIDLKAGGELDTGVRYLGDIEHLVDHDTASY